LQRFSPSYFIFILTSLPVIWILELRRVAQRRLANTNLNGTQAGFFDEFILQMGTDELDPTHDLPYAELVKSVQVLFVEKKCSFCCLLFLFSFT